MHDYLPTDSQLCGICGSVDFAAYFQPPVQGEVYSKSLTDVITYKEKDMGSRASIKYKAKHCKFCYLAYMATEGMPLRLPDDAIVSISSFCWGRNRGLDGTDFDATYCIRVIARVGVYETDGYIQLLKDDAKILGLSSHFRARVPTEVGFDMTKARTWLEICRTGHEGFCSTSGQKPNEQTPSPQPRDLIAIDLINMSLCHMPQGSDFIALSYCWPATPYLTLKRANNQELFKKDALLNHMNELPGTVQDAIICSRELPLQYLWIDALCIMQDDKDHKEKQLRQMDRVYSCASLTLVCAYPVARVPDMMTSYEYALSFYTYRDVSYPTDILNAFEGVSAVLSEAMGTSFWQGMPESILPNALCWQLRGPFRRRRMQAPGQPLPSKPLFPSWSWAGWESRVNLNYHVDVKTYQSEAEWFIVNDDSVATPLNVLNEGEPFRYSKHRPPPIEVFLPKIVPRVEVDATSPEWRDARILACCTTCTSFLIDGTRHLLNTIHEKLWPQAANYAIKDSQGVTAGCILLPHDFLATHGVESLEFEFILLCSSLQERHTGSRRPLLYFDEMVYPVRDWCTLNVMLISRLEGYKAIRVGVGIVHEDAWINSDPGTAFVELL
ncbi:hypothetical protein DM02DRAFT_562728 [Periconia macrospinosa]|uniref:Heterokaryon incompatibility domain-containing protein n=1 Tax=Periconia macrospinosa TaxID=97972 RepID=A0A2V1DQS7_9PLEO|nr:hypothetical protein DM02DRAFT_562728 [Periconia macrospinosa]